MYHNRREKTCVLSALRSHLRGFCRAEDGLITIFACMMIFMMLIIGGMGVDFMRHEMERTRIQAVADRAVLAAADLDQTRDPEAVVRDYFAKSGMADFVSKVDVANGLNFRTVTVEANSTFNTQFVDAVGVDELNVAAYSRAEEKINKVEISLVLDISGSMRRNSRMDNLKTAAGEFLDTVLVPGNQNLVSVSVVPYTAQVNAGAQIMSQLNVYRRHNYSSCVDFDSDDFYSTSISQTQSYSHMQHFEAGWYFNGSSSEGAISNPGCPKRSYEEIIGFSQDKNTLMGRINQFQPRANTAIHMGMKWGVAMLDPAFRPITAQLGVDSAFSSRPANYDDVETIKTVLLMTDGVNVPTVRISSRRYQWSGQRRDWSRYPLYWYLNAVGVPSYRHYAWYYEKFSSSQADTMLSNICDAAKEEGIIIWTIGLEVPDHGANVMRDCASSPSHFFRVEGLEIRDAFSSIARQINQLKLTQ